MINQLIDSGIGFPGASDIQNTSFSLDGIARFVCNTYDEAMQAQAQGNFEFDVVIVGSGMYGAYAAKTIFEASIRLSLQRAVRVLVLESGPFLISEHFQNLTRMGSFFDLVNQPVLDEGQAFVTQIDRIGGPLQGFSPHHRCVGGKSLFWGGWAPPLRHQDEQDDLARWPEAVRNYLISADGYARIARQIGTAETADFIKGPLAQRLKQKAQDVLDSGGLEVLTAVEDAPIAAQAQGPISGLFSMDKFSSLPLLLDSIREDAERSNGNNGNRALFLVPRAKVLRLETVNALVREVVIELQELSRDPARPGLVSRIARLPLKDSAVVILAGNTINSTRLALNSFPTPATLGPERMGRNLMAHVRGNYVWRIHHDAIGMQATDELASSALHIEGRAPVFESGRLGRFHFQFYALGGSGNNPEQYLYSLTPNIEDLEDIERAVARTDMNQWIVVGIRSCGEMFGDPEADLSQRASSFISVNPFGGSGDDVYFENGVELRVPKAYVCLVERPEDTAIRRAQTEAAFEFINQLAGVEGLASQSNIGDKVQLISSTEDGMGTTYHESGTLWLGDDPDNSVTDINGHFHHVTNAYCVDQSLFPSVGSANPVPTGLALSARVARHIVARLETQSPAAPALSGTRSLFDGTLDQWSQFGAGTIQALNGLNIIEAGTAGVADTLGFIRHAEKFRDFELTLEWKAFSGAANSGIFLRMPELQDSNFDALYAASIEIQIDETGKDFVPGRNPQSVYGSSRHKTGAVYGLAPATAWAAKAVSPRGAEGYWNRFRIELTGDRISVHLNDLRVVDRFQLPPSLTGEGYIGLQCHTDVVQFRNIRIRPL